MNEKLLQNHYNILKYKLLPGNDRINTAKFNKQYIETFQNVIKKYNNGTFHFTSYKKINTVNNRKVYLATIRDRVILNVLKDHIQYKYKINYKNRQNEIKKLINILSDCLPLTLIKLDIKDFFNSINKAKLFSKLNESSLLGSNEYLLISRALQQLKKGVGQGLPISNALAEIFMENLDWELKRISQNIAFYSRYVDDIIIILNGKLTDIELDDITTKIDDLLEKNSLVRNEKSIIQRLDTKTQFNYLGYLFTREEIIDDSKGDYKINLNIGITQSKYNKECKKIISTFKDYQQNKNFDKLEERLSILTCRNIIIKRTQKISSQVENNIEHNDKPICFGLIENYNQINNKDVLVNLDKFLAKNILIYVSDKKKRNRLFRFSYFRNFNSKRTNNFSAYTKNRFIDLMFNMDIGKTFDEDDDYEHFYTYYFNQLDEVELQQLYLKDILSVFKV
ncbi:MAG: hypothetical protein KIC94_08885 [Clostridiales bacterium]|nr:hypothetical protein [Clostridiales bacterium]